MEQEREVITPDKADPIKVVACSRLGRVAYRALKSNVQQWWM